MITETENDGAATLNRRFYYGPGIDEPIAMRDMTNGKSYFYHYDGLGSVVALSDANGTIVEKYKYDVFGDVTLFDINGVEISESGVGNPYYFTGRRYDDESGLYYYRARYYKPGIGRFLQTDPIGYRAGLNLYTYVGNNPVNWVDPMGLAECQPGESFKWKRCWRSNKGFEVDPGKLRNLGQNLALLVSIFVRSTSVTVVSSLASNSLMTNATWVGIRSCWDEYCVTALFKCIDCKWQVDIRRNGNRKCGPWRKEFVPAADYFAEEAIGALALLAQRDYPGDFSSKRR